MPLAGAVGVGRDRARRCGEACRPIFSPEGLTFVACACRGVPEEDVSNPFTEMVHGWVTRGDDTKNEAIARDQNEALRLCAAFILKHGGGGAKI